MATLAGLAWQGALGSTFAMTDVQLREFTASDKDWLVQQHSRIYADAEGFDDTFGPLVADILDEFIRNARPMRDYGWIAEQEGRRLGSIFCVHVSDQLAKLRMFLLVPEARGKGLGKRLIRACMQFARDAGYEEMQLWTHESHRAACALYLSHGWTLQSSKPVRSFGQDLIEQSWSIRL